jgi:acetyltransferase-like isoleucine patch superfamily enzyme
MNKPRILKVGIVDVDFGKDVTVIEPVNLYGCTIGDNSFVGPFVEIQRNVTIGSDCRIQSHAFICELVTIGHDCFISHGAMFINDTFQDGKPTRIEDDSIPIEEVWKSTTIGNNVCIGTNATILPVSICNNVVIGAGAVVTKNITKPGFYAGNPVRKIRNM